METSQLKLFSISAAAKALTIGKDRMNRLIEEGKIGYIEMGKRRKIPRQELVRFQNENTIQKCMPKTKYDASRLLGEEIYVSTGSRTSRKMDTRNDLKTILGVE